MGQIGKDKITSEKQEPRAECILKPGRDKPNIENHRPIYFPYRNKSAI